MTNELTKIKKNNNANKYWPENPASQRIWSLLFKINGVWIDWAEYSTKEKAVKFANKFNTDKEYRQYIYKTCDYINKQHVDHP